METRSRLSWGVSQRSSLSITMMRLFKPLLPLALVACAIGCDPRAGVYVQQPLTPATTSECIGAALRASSLVVSVKPLDSAPSQQYEVVVRDSTVPNGRRWAEVEIEQAAAGGTLASIEFGSGTTTWTVSDDHARHLRALGAQIAAELRARCAPDAPTTVSCRIQGFGPTRDCEAAG